jgi:nucleoside-diphosphate-sugar epimerase
MLLRNKKVLVTGGAGFIGSHIVDEMVKRNCEVTVIDHLESKSHEKNLEKSIASITLVKGSVTNKKLVKSLVDVDVIFYEASLTFASSIMFPKKASAVNTGGTLNVLEAMKETGSKAVLVYGSTGSVYGKALYSPQDESHPCNPPNPYSISKYASERYVSFFAEQRGFKTVVLRYYNVVGVRQNINSGILPSFIRSVLIGNSPQVENDGTQKRCFTSVEDVVRANVLAYEVEAGRGLAFNIAGDEIITVNELAKLVCSLSGKNINPIRILRRLEETYSFEPSIKLARNFLGYSPKNRLKDVLPDLMEWMKCELRL